MKQWFIKEIREDVLLLRSVPTLVVVFFTISVVCMNLLANKTIVSNAYIALDGGILLSWLSFLCMDILTMYFGPKASSKVAIFAIAINLFCSMVFYIASIIPSNASDYSGFDSIFGGTWFILLGSTIAFIVSAIINNAINHLIGRALSEKKLSKKVYYLRSFTSTFIGQFIDNLAFSTIVFMVFAPIFWDGFSWTLVQCITCALTGALLELLMEAIFSPLGYKIVTKWQKEGIGKAYLAYIEVKR